jgi:hypothetical protein
MSCLWTRDVQALAGWNASPEDFMSDTIHEPKLYAVYFAGLVAPLGKIRVFVGEFGSFDQSSLDGERRPGAVLLCLVFGPRSSTRIFSEFLLNGC